MLRHPFQTVKLFKRLCLLKTRNPIMCESHIRGPLHIELRQYACPSIHLVRLSNAYGFATEEDSTKFQCMHLLTQ